MLLHLLEQTQKFPASMEEVWAFFSDPRNLPRITPPAMRLRITSPLPPAMYAGMLVSYRVRPLPAMTVDWVTQITHVEPSVRFVDEQRIGPYRFFQHQHAFREIEGGVEMHDLVQYALPRGGGMARRFLVAPALRDMFIYRNQTLAELLGAWTGG
ncbi:SRPBCC family protein [Longimicrobium sp.]|uniref:SRPBCC family protein n=1 Tax=Longimicrobium sp. TaxID=2029185 RepID=UPI002BA87BFC|nr:SRPBCC family protein [Longimicrobium sp.]HSU17625.1 SRPBCC family protein [Longimicrobium sp.]